MKNNPPLIMDMVHHNPGEPLFETPYNEPSYVAEVGYNSKAYFLFESPTLAIDWNSVEADVFPAGSDERAWVEKKAAVIRAQHVKCREAGLQIYAQTDMVLLPKKLIQAYGIQDTFGDPNHPVTIDLIKKQIAESFAQFPELDGLLVRIGETYLHDAPYHEGSITDKNDTDHTIIPLLKLLREEVCVKHNKKLIFRSWLSFDRNPDQYQQINDAVEPHDNLIIAIKHVEDDFHRGIAFSRSIGQGRHPQLIEVQCSREYEGKAAYPNYIAAGVIEGFEEHQNKGLPIDSLRAFTEKHPDLFAGVWTWSRGGGWNGPYTANKLWYDLNAWVMANWTRDTTQSEEAVFMRYARERLHLPEDSIAAFRKLCLLSLDGVIRMRNTVEGDLDLWWTRDAGIGWPKYLNDDPETISRCLAQKNEAITIWEEMVTLAKGIQWPDADLADFAIGSVNYGLGMSRIYHSLFYLDAAKRQDDPQKIAEGIAMYDAAWEFYNSLPGKFKHLSSQYSKDYALHVNPADAVVNQLRK
jgi:hypothetical protein